MPKSTYRKPRNNCRQEIEKELAKRGEPLRWAITEVDSENNQVKVEAIVTTAS